MMIRDMFADDINRKINGVIKVDQAADEVIEQELNEYVITRELKKHFITFFNYYGDAFDQPTADMGVWISGFFGSGKSYFLKMLSYLLENKEVKNIRSVERFRKKYEDDPATFMLIDRATKGPTETILFNIDIEGFSNKDKTAVLRVFAKMFYNHLGFYGENLKVVMMERYIDQQGKTEEFRRVFEEKKGKSWLEMRRAFAFNGKFIIPTLMEVLDMSEGDAKAWFHDKTATEISISQLVEDMKAYVDTKPANFRLLFMIDEVGQYVGTDTDMLLNLQSLTEKIGSECEGKIWVICTGQEALDEIIKVRTDEFSRIQARFKTRLSLSSSSVDEVIQKRILKKKRSVAKALETVYEQNDSVLRNLFSFSGSILDIKGYSGSLEFSDNFPFVPYQFIIMQKVFAEIRKHGNSGKHLSGGERSMLSGFQEAAQKIQEEDEYALVPFFRFYDTVHTFLDGSIRRVIERCQKAADNGDGIEQQDVDVLKLLYLIRYIDDIPANLDNIVILMADDIRVDKIVMREAVRGCLDRLMSQNYIGRTGDIYNFLTDEEQDIQREIKNTPVDTASIVERIAQMIYGDIFATKKFRYGKYDFPFAQMVDGTTVGVTTGGMRLRFLTVATDSAEKTDFRLMTESKGNEAIIVLADTPYYESLESAMKIRKYVKQRNVSQLPKSVQKIISDQQEEASKYELDAMKDLQTAIETAQFFVDGEHLEIKAGNAKSKINQSLEYLVAHVYSKLDLITKNADSDADIIAILTGAETMIPGTEPNRDAASTMEEYLEMQDARKLPTSMADVQSKYSAIPYGWKEIDIAAVAAQLIYAQKFAVWARTELIARVSLKGVEYGITEDNIVDATADSINGKVLTDDEKKQRQALIAEMKEKGYKQVMEEVAYTWFNRFSALRFMEVNGYLPSHVRVFTDEENNFKPQIITEAIHLDLDGLDMEKVFALKEAEKTEELYKYLLIVQCNALNKILPGMFQKIADYTELLLPDNLLREGSVIQQMIELIPEDDWKDAVQIIGWLYQYYNSEKKDDVFAALKKNVKITKENIPAATQLFTPDWIVRYMVENSLGRLWVEGHPNDELKSQWKYYLEEAEQEPEVQAQLAEIRKEYAALTPEQLKVIDPCSGSGHILAYMFDVLMQIYEAYGYTTREAVASIVENNIYGLDIDDRAAQLAYFAVMMKARQYDRRFFSRGIQPRVYAIVESNHVDKFAVEYFCNGDAKLKAAIDTIISELYDAKEYGSILTVTPQDWSALYNRFAEIVEDIHISRETALQELLPLVQVAEALALEYEIIVTNPPYMGSNNMGATLSSFVKTNYPNSKSDMSTVFMELCQQRCKHNGMYAMINIPVWMTQSSFSTLRKDMFGNSTFINMLHFGRGVFGSDFGTTSFVIRSGLMKDYSATYRRLFDGLTQVDLIDVKERRFFEGKGTFYAKQNLFEKIDGFPLAYWITSGQVAAFTFPALNTLAEPRQGFATGDNERFLRFWQEVDFSHAAFGCKSREDAQQSGSRWFPCNKGGAFRRWYGNNERLVNWENDGAEMIAFSGSVIRNPSYYFRQGMTWSTATMSKLSMRYSPVGFLFESKGSVCFPIDDRNLNYLLALLNTKIVEKLLLVLAPTVDYHEGPLGRVPVILSVKYFEDVSQLSERCIGLAKVDWDCFETSWDFKHHPLIDKVSTLAEAFDQWKNECDTRFNQLKANEEELNCIFINIYGLQDELTPEVEDKDVTVRKADLGRDIRSFLSYAVGCMFGRYSLDMDGLAYAGGEWDNSKYVSFSADKDNIIPICDDEYFEDDIVGRFVEFVKTVYGEETLDENLKFIADALGGKGQPKDVIRNYFLNGFYADHCKIYQKRPIYWLFDSGKKNGFKALIYMHRYQPDTIARIRTDYVHEQQARYRTAIADLEQRIVGVSTGERVKLNKKLAILQAQDTEIRTYEEKIHHLADQMISIDLDDGVKKNYVIFQDVLAKIK